MRVGWDGREHRRARPAFQLTKFLHSTFPTASAEISGSPALYSGAAGGNIEGNTARGRACNGEGPPSYLRNLALLTSTAEPSMKAIGFAGFQKLILRASSRGIPGNKVQKGGISHQRIAQEWESVDSRLTRATATSPRTQWTFCRSSLARALI